MKYVNINSDKYSFNGTNAKAIFPGLVIPALPFGVFLANGPSPICKMGLIIIFPYAHGVIVNIK